MPPEIETGPLTLDQAENVLSEATAPEATAEVVEPVEAPAEAEATETEEAPPEAPEGALEGDEVEEPTTEEPEPAKPAIEPPPFWSAEHKAAFAELPPALQETVKAYEDNRNRFTTQKLSEAANVVRAAQAEADNLSAQRTRIDQLLGDVDAKIKADGWENVDWAAWARSNPGEALAYKLEFDSLAAQRTQLEQAKRVADDTAFKAYLQTESVKLSQIAPHLAQDPGRRAEIGRYVSEAGYPPEALNSISALDLLIAEKAMLYDKAQAGATQTLKPATPVRAAPKPATPPVKPGAAAPQLAPVKRATQEANNRFSQTRDIDDAVALLNAKG